MVGPEDLCDSANKKCVREGRAECLLPAERAFPSAVMKATVWGGRDSVVKAEGVRRRAYSLVAVKRKRRGRGL